MTTTAVSSSSWNEVYTRQNFDNLNLEELISEVSNIWKTFAENDNSLWQNRLLSLKGEGFTSRSLPHPRNFIFLDQALTKAFRLAVKEDRPALAENLKGVSVYNLDKRIVQIVAPNRDKLFTLTVRLPEESIQLLESTSCLDSKAWLETLKKVATHIYANFPDCQRTQGFLKEDLWFLANVKTKFDKPDEKLKNLIREHGITDTFFFKNGDLVMSFNNQKSDIDTVIHSMLEGKDLNLYVNHRLVNSFLKAMNERDFKNCPNYTISIRTRLQNPSSDMEDFLRKRIEKYSDEGSSLLKKVFFSKV